MYVRMETTSRDSFWVDLVFRLWNVAGRSNFVGARHQAGARPYNRQLQVGRDGAFSES